MAPAGIAIAPRSLPEIEAALREAGAGLVEPGEADAIVWTEPRDPAALAALLEPRHRWVALPITGIEGWLASGVVDRARIWTCARGVYADGVAEHGLGLILAGARRLPAYARARSWRPLPGDRLRGATVTVLGAGAIGRRLAALLQPTGARLIAVTRRGEPLPEFGRTVTLDGLGGVLEETDFLVVASALTDQTRGVVEAGALGALGPRGVLVNLARGEIVDTAALVGALQAGRLGGALLDVTDPEPLPDGHPLWELDNVLITPHVANPNAGAPWDSHMRELCEHLRANARAFAAGEPLDGEIDLDAGY